MGHIDSALKLEERLYNALLREEYDEFQELLKDREALYRSFVEESPEEFKSYMDSSLMKGMKEKINSLYYEKKEGIMNEMQELDRSRKAAEGYMGSSNNAPNIFSRSI